MQVLDLAIRKLLLVEVNMVLVGQNEKLEFKKLKELSDGEEIGYRRMLKKKKKKDGGDRVLQLE